MNIPQLSGLVLDFFGALLLTITEIKSRREIEKEVGTYFDSNPYLKKSLEERSFLAILSTNLLTVGFVLQIIGLTS